MFKHYRASILNSQSIDRLSELQCVYITMPHFLAINIQQKGLGALSIGWCHRHNYYNVWPYAVEITLELTHHYNDSLKV